MGHKRIKRCKDISKVKKKMKSIEQGRVEPICCRGCYHKEVQQDKKHLKFEEQYSKKHYHNEIFGK